MGELRRKVGFLPNLGRQRVVSLLWPEGLFALTIGGLGFYVLYGSSTASVQNQLAGDLLTVLAPLLGVVLAALAVVVAVTSLETRLAMDQVPNGVMAFFSPFILAIGFEIVAILVVLGYRATAELVDPSTQRWLFATVGAVAVFALVDVLAVARTVLMHALLATTSQKSATAPQRPDA